MVSWLPYSIGFGCGFAALAFAFVPSHFYDMNSPSMHTEEMLERKRAGHGFMSANTVAVMNPMGC